MKRSGFAVRITAFIEADPKDAKSIKDALDLIDMKLDDMRFSDVHIIKHSTRFMLSREVPDEPKAAQPTYVVPDNWPSVPVVEMPQTSEMPPIPAPLRRA